MSTEISNNENARIQKINEDILDKDILFQPSKDNASNMIDFNFNMSINTSNIDFPDPNMFMKSLRPKFNYINVMKIKNNLLTSTATTNTTPSVMDSEKKKLKSVKGNKDKPIIIKFSDGKFSDEHGVCVLTNSFYDYISQNDIDIHDILR